MTTSETQSTTETKSIPQALNPFSMKLNSISLIEASAGSGKTYNIVNLFLRLLLNVGDNLDQFTADLGYECNHILDLTDALDQDVISHNVAKSPLNQRLRAKEILVVTFTKAATKEMSSRISNKLIDILGKLQTVKAYLDQQISTSGKTTSTYDYQKVDHNNMLTNIITDGYFEIFADELEKCKNISERELTILETNSELEPYFRYTPKTIKQALLALDESDPFTLKVLNQIIAQGRVQSCIDILKTEIINNEFSIQTIDSFCKEAVDTYSLLNEQTLYRFENLSKELITKALELVIKENFIETSSVELSSQIALFNLGKYGTQVTSLLKTIYNEKGNLEFCEDIEFLLNKIYPSANPKYDFSKPKGFIEYCENMFKNFSLQSINDLAHNLAINSQTTVKTLIYHQLRTAKIYLEKTRCKESSLLGWEKINETITIPTDPKVLDEELAKELADFSLADSDYSPVLFVNFYQQWLAFFLQKTYLKYLELCDQEKVIYFDGYQRTLRNLLFNQSHNQTINSADNSSHQQGSKSPTQDNSTENTTTNNLKNAINNSVNNITNNRANDNTANIILNSIRNQYKFGIIDEFQDTSPIQFDIFSKIFIDKTDSVNNSTTNSAINSETSSEYVSANSSEPNHSVTSTNNNSINRSEENAMHSPTERGFIMIGDPKQSIYAFRGADIFSYFTAREQAEYIYTISNNYRSSPDFINSCNQMFGARNDAFHLPLISYPLAKAGRTEMKGITFAGQTVSPITFMNWKEFIKVNKECDIHEYMANFIAKCIELGNLGLLKLNGKNLEPKDICVLESSHKKNDKIKAKLQALGINTNSNKSLKIDKELPAYVSLTTLLKAVANLQKVDIYKHIFSYLSGLDLNQSQELIKNNEVYANYVSKLQHYQQVWREHGILAMVQNVVLDNQILARSQSYANPQLILELQDIFNLLDYIIRTVPDSNQATEVLYFLDNLEHQKTKHEDESEANIRESKLENRNSVQISTIHASKGLEYGLVFSTFDGLQSDGLQKERLKLSDYPPKLNKFLNPFSNIDSLFLCDNKLSETQRLFYVLLTRPKFGYVGFVKPSSIGKKFPDLITEEFLDFHNYNNQLEPVVYHPAYNDIKNLDQVNYYDFYIKELQKEYDRSCDFEVFNQSKINMDVYDPVFGASLLTNLINSDFKVSLVDIAENKELQKTFYNEYLDEVPKRISYALSYFLPPHLALAFAQADNDTIKHVLSPYTTKTPNLYTHSLDGKKVISSEDFTELTEKMCNQNDEEGNDYYYFYPVNPQISSIDLFSQINHWIFDDQAWQEYKASIQELNSSLGLFEQNSLEEQLDQQDKQKKQDQQPASQLAQDLAHNLMPYLVKPVSSIILSPAKAKALYNYQIQAKTGFIDQVLPNNHEHKLNEQIIKSFNNPYTLNLNLLSFDNYLEQEVSLVTGKPLTESEDATTNTNQNFTLYQNFLASLNPYDQTEPYHLLMLSQEFSPYPSKSIKRLQSFTNLNRVTKDWFNQSVHTNPIFRYLEQQQGVELGRIEQIQPTKLETTNQQFNLNDDLDLQDITSEKFASYQAVSQTLTNLAKEHTSNLLAERHPEVSLALFNDYQLGVNDEIDSQNQDEFSFSENEIQGYNDLELDFGNDLSSDLDFNLNLELDQNLFQNLNQNLSQNFYQNLDSEFFQSENTTDKSLQTKLDLEQDFTSTAINASKTNSKLSIPDKLVDKNSNLNQSNLDQANLDQANSGQTSLDENNLDEKYLDDYGLSIEQTLMLLPGGTNFGTRVHKFYELYDPIKPKQSEQALQQLVNSYNGETGKAICKMMIDSLQYPLVDLTSLTSKQLLSTRQQLTLDLYRTISPDTEIDLTKVNLDDFEQGQSLANNQHIQSFVAQQTQIHSITKPADHQFLKLASLDTERVNEWSFVIRPPVADGQESYMLDFIKVLVDHKILLKDFYTLLKSASNQSLLYRLLVNGKFEGAVDLILFTNQQVFIIDYKTNNLGNNLADYNNLNLFRYMHKSGYILQIYIYLATTYAYLNQSVFANSQANLENLQFVGMNLFTRAMLEVDNEFKNTGIYIELPSHELLQQLAQIIQPYLSFNSPKN